MITDRDITVRVTAAGLDPRATAVRAVMTPGAIYCFDRDELEDAAELMCERAIRRLVVLDRELQLVGVLSLDDLLARGVAWRWRAAARPTAPL